MQDANKQKTILIVSLVHAITNVILSLLKIIVGYLGHSQALIADGIHSFSDLMGDALVLIAARASDQVPDKEHPYGHRRIETIVSIVIALILLSVGVMICVDAFSRIMHPHFIERPTFPVIVIAVISILINEWLFHYTHRQGKKIDSNLLIVNAWHKRSDTFVSVIVLLSVIGAMSGLRILDAIGAMLIALFIFQMAGKMIWQAGQELIDHGADEKTLAEIENTIRRVSGVRSIHQLRTRLHGNMILVDSHIIVDPFISVSEGHHIGEQVHFNLMKNIKNLHDVTVHIDPENDEIVRSSLHLPNREKINQLLKTRWKNLPGHNKMKKITLHYLAGNLYIEVFLPQSVASKASAEELVSQYQQQVQDIEEIASVVIHFMPENK